MTKNITVTDDFFKYIANITKEYSRDRFPIKNIVNTTKECNRDRFLVQDIVDVN